MKMSSGERVGIAAGTSGAQLSLGQLYSSLKAAENESKLSKEIETNFFVGPNGKVLPSKFKKWIGKSRREHLLKRAKNIKLKNAVNQLYRPKSFIGNGGTASVIKFEKATGYGLGRNGKTHMQKGREMIKYLEKKVLSQNNLSSGDRKLAYYLINELKKAVYGG